MTRELAERVPFESAGIESERLDDIAASGLEQKDCEDHQRDAEPDGPPVFFQIKFFPAPPLWFCGLTAPAPRPPHPHDLGSPPFLRFLIRPRARRVSVF